MSISRTAYDGEGKIVYVSLNRKLDPFLRVLRLSLVRVQPVTRYLERLRPINKSRVLVEVVDEEVQRHFEAWLTDTYADPVTGPPFAQLLAPLGNRIRMVGIQWIIPKVTEYDRLIAPQLPHTDINRKGAVIAIGISISGNPLGTLINPNASVNEQGVVSGWEGFHCVDSDVFAYDAGVVHAGPGQSNVSPPYPRYFIDRVFVLLCGEEANESEIARYRRDNGLTDIEYWDHKRVISLNTPTECT